jgi:pimeloyl-ACP methyl ester carboxylesterase
MKMARPLVLIHGYSAGGLDFSALVKALHARGVNAVDLNIANYVSLNNEITVKDIAEGLDRAFRQTPALNAVQEFDAIVHSTGMLVIRSWLTNYGAAVDSNVRLGRLKHLVGLAPATWGSPQAHKGRTWLGALVKGNRTPGPDFMNAGDEVLDALELGSKFTWDLAHADLLGPKPYYGKGDNTPYVCVFIGNTPYEGLSSVANDPGTDGTVRWSGCALNTRKIVVDLTRTPDKKDGTAASRVTLTPWEDSRLDIPCIPVEGRNHATLVSEPDDRMVDLVYRFLGIADEAAHQSWLEDAKAFGEPSWAKMLIDPGKAAAGVEADFRTFFGHLMRLSEGTIEGWQQFVVHARDERGDSVTDYMIDIFRRNDATGDWEKFEEMSTDVHAYRTDASYRCFHIRLPQGITAGKTGLKLQIHASTGTALMAYQGYSSNDDGQRMTAIAEPVEIEVAAPDGSSGFLFKPFTTTLVEIILNREPAPLNAFSDVLRWLPSDELLKEQGAG